MTLIYIEKCILVLKQLVLIAWMVLISSGLNSRFYCNTLKFIVLKATFINDKKQQLL